MEKAGILGGKSVDRKFIEKLVLSWLFKVLRF